MQTINVHLVATFKKKYIYSPCTTCCTMETVILLQKSTVGEVNFR